MAKKCPFNDEMVRFIQGIDFFFKDAFRELDLPRIKILLEVAAADDKGGVTQHDLAQTTGLSKFTISRSISALADENLGLVEQRGMDAENFRTVRVGLTKRGREYIRKLEKTVSVSQ